MSDAVAIARPDTSDMVSVHKVFREALAAAPRLVGEATPSDPEHLSNIASYYANVLAFLHVHHEGEDELLWPKLLERCPDEAERVNEIAEQHGGVSGALREAEAHLLEWSEQPTDRNGAGLTAALYRLGVELGPHLDQEEEYVLPLAARHLSVEEWAQFPAHGLQHFSGDKIWVLLGLLLEAFPPKQREDMLRNLPPPVLEFWTNAGRLQFDAYIADVRR